MHGLSEMVGLFINTPPLRVSADGRMTVSDLYKEFKVMSKEELNMKRLQLLI